MPLVIIEGPDRTGKTTLAKVLVEELNAVYWHRGAPTAPPLIEYVLELEKNYDPTRWHVIDRWHVGQTIYPRLYPEGREALSDEEYLWIELALVSYGVYMVFTTGGVWEIRERVLGDEDSYLKPVDVEACIEMFSSAATSLFHPRTIVYAINADADPSATKAGARLASMLRKNACTAEMTTAYDISNEYEITGFLNDPSTLLVGDQVGKPTPKEATHRLPFAPHSGTSGHYLMRTLTNLDVRSDVAIVNARDHEGTITNLHKLHRLLGKPNVVALGRKACDVLTAQGVEHGGVPHPQWVRRFKHDMSERYGHMITIASLTGRGYTTEELDV